MIEEFVWTGRRIFEMMQHFMMMCILFCKFCKFDILETIDKFL